MPGKKINARDVIIEVSDGSDSSTWVEVDGLNSITINQSENEEVAETTTFSSQGQYEQEIMQRGATLELAGFIYKKSDGTRDPGQARLEEVGLLVAEESVTPVRFRYPVDTEWTIWDATVTIGEKGGGNNNKSAWACTLTRSGDSTTATVDTGA